MVSQYVAGNPLEREESAGFKSGAPLRSLQQKRILPEYLLEVTARIQKTALPRKEQSGCSGFCFYLFSPLPLEDYSTVTDLARLRG